MAVLTRVKNKVNVGSITLTLSLIVICSVGLAGFSSLMAGGFVQMFSSSSQSPEFTVFYGLPSDFIPKVGYYNGMGSSTVELWGEDGRFFRSADGINYQEVQKPSLLAGIVPKAGLYWPFGLGGLALFDDNETRYVYQSGDWFLHPKGKLYEQYRCLSETDPNYTQNCIPSTFKLKTSYYNLFGNGAIVFWGEGGELYSHQMTSPSKLLNLTSWEGPLNLPVNESPEVGYYFDFGSGRKALNLWYSSLQKSNSAPVVREYTGSGVYKDAVRYGLLFGQTPQVGYFDQMRKKVVLWYSDGSVYESSNGQNFVRVPVVKCRDIGDGGDNPAVAGSATDNGGYSVQADSCSYNSANATHRLSETYCGDDDAVQTRLYTCSTCDNGAGTNCSACVPYKNTGFCWVDISSRNVIPDLQDYYGGFKIAYRPPSGYDFTSTYVRVGYEDPAPNTNNGNISSCEYMNFLTGQGWSNLSVEQINGQDFVVGRYNSKISVLWLTSGEPAKFVAIDIFDVHEGDMQSFMNRELEADGIITQYLKYYSNILGDCHSCVRSQPTYTTDGEGQRNGLMRIKNNDNEYCDSTTFDLRLADPVPVGIELDPNYAQMTISPGGFNEGRFWTYDVCNIIHEDINIEVDSDHHDSEVFTFHDFSCS